MRNPKKTLLIPLTIAVLGSSGLAAYAASKPSGGAVADRAGGVPVYEAPKYAVNGAGQTFGRADGNVSPEDEPDLILAEATNGKIGYVSKAELDLATGAYVSSPEEALEWEQQKANRSSKSEMIAVFESDGTTQIGWFEVIHSVGEPAKG